MFFLISVTCVRKSRGLSTIHYLQMMPHILWAQDRFITIVSLSKHYQKVTNGRVQRSMSLDCFDVANYYYGVAINSLIISMIFLIDIIFLIDMIFPFNTIRLMSGRIISFRLFSSITSRCALEQTLHKNTPFPAWLIVFA